MNQFESEKILDKVNNVLEIPKFKPIVTMCEDWLSQRDETKFEKTNNELLKRYMDTLWLPMGWSEKFTCKFVTKFDFIEDTDKAKCWKGCAINYLKSKQ
jgi:hypothetical protein